MKTKDAVVIGAGFGGLSAAALLAKDGHRVTVLEKNESPGGRARVWKSDGFTFDMGPSWYLMPDVFERFFRHFGKRPEDYYELVRLDPAYRMIFGRDDVVDISADLDATLAQFEALEEGGAGKLSRYLAQSEHQYDVAMREFIYREYGSVLDMANRRLLLEGRKLRVFETMDRFVARHFEDERARKILQYNLVFLGGAPKITPALYSIMTHIDLNLGVWYPRGGLGSVVRGLQDLAVSQGVAFHFGRPVTRIEVRGREARRVHTEDGAIDADLVVMNGDYHHGETQLLDVASRTYRESYWRRRTVAPSAFIAYLGLDRTVDGLTHHNLFLDRDWVAHFDAIFERPSWPEDPSFYVCAPSKTDPSVAPAGKENLFVLVPVAAGLPDTPDIRARYYENVMGRIEAVLGERIRDDVAVRRTYALDDFARDYNAYRGTALGLSHNLRQTAAFRPRHRSKRVRNLWYTGQYTHPGIGVPMALISSEIVAGEIAKDAAARASPVAEPRSWPRRLLRKVAGEPL